MPDTPHPFQTLTPSFIMDAVESQGFSCDCRTFALNSYENRVYQVGIDAGLPLIAKFYRPNRWSDEQILEEHNFCFELQEYELPVVAPWVNAARESLFHYGIFRFALYPRQGGHAPEFDNLDNLLILGRMLGRIHAIGAVRPFSHRPALEHPGHLLHLPVSEAPADQITKARRGRHLPASAVEEKVEEGVVRGRNRPSEGLLLGLGRVQRQHRPREGEQVGGADHDARASSRYSRCSDTLWK